MTALPAIASKLSRLVAEERRRFLQNHRHTMALGEAAARAMRKALDPELMAALHLWLINRGAPIAPFHNMMLVSPATTDARCDRLAAPVAGFADRLQGAST